MGTHPIFESDFDCLTGSEWADAIEWPLSPPTRCGTTSTFGPLSQMNTSNKLGDFLPRLTRSCALRVGRLVTFYAILCRTIWTLRPRQSPMKWSHYSRRSRFGC